MEPAIQSILEQNEEIKWEGKQDGGAAVASSIFGMLVVAAVGVIFYSFGGATTGTCTINNVARPAVECAHYARLASYAIFALALLIPLLSYWHYKVTGYLITNKRLLIKSGFIGADFNSIYYDRVHAVSVNVGLIGKIFGTGTILIDTGKTEITNTKHGGTSHVVFERFSSIKDPYGVYKILQEMLGANKSALYSGKGV